MSKFKFKPKKDCDRNGQTNGLRANRGDKALDTYREVAGFAGVKFEDCMVQDLITDLCHLLDREKVDVKQSIDMALHNWREER